MIYIRRHKKKMGRLGPTWRVNSSFFAERVHVILVLLFVQGEVDAMRLERYALIYSAQLHDVECTIQWQIQALSHISIIYLNTKKHPRNAPPRAVHIPSWSSSWRKLTIWFTSPLVFLRLIFFSEKFETRNKIVPSRYNRRNNNFFLYPSF